MTQFADGVCKNDSFLSLLRQHVWVGKRSICLDTYTHIEESRHIFENNIFVSTCTSICIYIYI